MNTPLNLYTKDKTSNTIHQIAKGSTKTQDVMPNRNDIYRKSKGYRHLCNNIA